MITLVTRTDLHLSVQPPQSRTDDWAATCLGKLEQVGVIAREVGAAGVLDNGDFFHIKTPSQTTHELIQRVSAVHAPYPCGVWANIGNHDCKYGDYKFISEAPLGVLFGTGVFQRCYDEHEAVFERDGLKVRVVGIPYHGKSYDTNRMTTIVKGDEDYLVVMAHLLASPDGGEMFGSEDIVAYADLANLDPDLWLFGHWHKNQGVVKIGTKIIINIGSLTRGALSEDEITRVPECSIIRFTKQGIDVERRPLKVQPAADVFDLVGRTRQLAKVMTVDAFVDSVRNTLQASQMSSLLDVVRALDVPDAVRERLLGYLEAEGAT